MKKILLAILLAIVSLSACKKSLVGEEKAKEQARIDDAIIQQYIADNNLQDSAKRIDTTGVFYIVRKPGTGSVVFTNSTYVTVGFSARLLTTGQLIDETDTFHPSYILGGNIIKAWKLGIPQIQKEGVVRLLVPSRYAYGPYPQPSSGLPANAVLDFIITLYDVTN
ncbi:MAG: peptidylprolyl isomerase [Sphingobacteriales bacterium]|nr:MAG: peptidylprolyl isomerase [Sphingobacteriales bacterium]